MPNISIEQLLDMNVIQELQDAYSEFTGLAAMITDSGGRQVTNTSGFTDVCLNHIRTSAERVRKCMDHCVTGAFEAVKNENAYIYKCHGGLICFTAPIMLDDMVIGCFSSGQVICTDEDERQLFVRFSDMGFEPDKCVRLTEGIKRVTPQELRRAASFLYKLSQVLSATAHKNYVLMRKNEMQVNDILPDMNTYLNSIKNPEFERLYNTRELFGTFSDGMAKTCAEKGVDFKLEIDELLPVMLLGNPNLLKIGLEAAMGPILSFTTSKDIRLEATYIKTNYSCCLVVDIVAFGDFLPDEELYEINRNIYLNNSSSSDDDKEDTGKILTDVIIKKLSGNFRVINIEGKGTATHITLPQLTDKEN